MYSEVLWSFTSVLYRVGCPSCRWGWGGFCPRVNALTFCCNPDSLSRKIGVRKEEFVAAPHRTVKQYKSETPHIHRKPADVFI